MIAFGPVPSRRLGRSLGINNIPPKICSYACVYCQLGRTLKMVSDRRAFYDPGEVRRAVRERVERAAAAGEPVGYLTFVPDGEPTLDRHLGQEIEALKAFGLPVAVITNASLIWRRDVRDHLMGADWVSLKVDAVRDAVWRRINRPHGSLRLADVLRGALRFAREYRGRLVTETMLVAGVNDDEESVGGVAAFLALLKPAAAYLSIPTRPPAEAWVRPPGEPALNRAYHRLREKGLNVEYLIGYEGNAFAFTGDVAEDLLSITAVHPMRRDAVDDFLSRAGADWAVVLRLVEEGELVETEYGDHLFYLRKLRMHDGA